METVKTLLIPAAIPKEQRWALLVIRLFALLIYIPIGLISSYLTIFYIVVITPPQHVSLQVPETWTLIFPATAAFCFLAGLGLWRLKNWARRMTIGAFAIGILLGILFIYTNTNLLQGAVELIVSGVGLLGFMKGPVKTLFTRSVITEAAYVAQPAADQDKSLTDCPHCRKRTASEIKYCVECGSDLTTPGLRDDLQNLLQKLERGYALKTKALSKIAANDLDGKVFRRVYTDYAANISALEKNLRDSVNGILNEAGAHRKEIKRITDHVRELRLRTDIGEIREADMVKNLPSLNKQLTGIHKRLQFLSSLLGAVQEAYSENPDTGKACAFITNASSCLGALNADKASNSSLTLVEQDIQNSNNSITYFNSKAQKKLVDASPIKLCITCGNELSPDEPCPACNNLK
ncbi:MAG: hypothetical protein HYY22_04385 [Thaumarchaeota archaeon]|nr:hypothetical protein [Nitrososphaerota archaeon]